MQSTCYQTFERISSFKFKITKNDTDVQLLFFRIHVMANMKSFRELSEINILPMTRFPSPYHSNDTLSLPILYSMLQQLWHSVYLEVKSQFAVCRCLALPKPVCMLLAAVNIAHLLNCHICTIQKTKHNVFAKQIYF